MVVDIPAEGSISSKTSTGTWGTYITPMQIRSQSIYTASLVVEGTTKINGTASFHNVSCSGYLSASSMRVDTLYNTASLTLSSPQLIFRLDDWTILWSKKRFSYTVSTAFSEIYQESSLSIHYPEDHSSSVLSKVEATNYNVFPINISASTLSLYVSKGTGSSQTSSWYKAYLPGQVTSYQLSPNQSINISLSSPVTGTNVRCSDIKGLSLNGIYQTTSS